MALLEFKSTLIAVDNDLQQVQQRLEDMVQHSSTILLKNLVEETRSQIAQTYIKSITDRERAAIFASINQAWLRLWEQFKHIPEVKTMIISYEAQEGFPIRVNPAQAIGLGFCCMVLNMACRKACARFGLFKSSV